MKRKGFSTTENTERTEVDAVGSGRSVANTEDLPDGFQMTELGPLPKEWRVVRLGEVVKLTKGRKPDELIPKYQFGALPYLTADYFRNRLPTEWVPAQYLSKLPLCSKEDVVLIWDGSKAGQVFIGLEGVLASTMVRIDPEKQIERHYLYYFLLTRFDLLNSKTTGTTIPHVNKEVFRNLSIPLPPLPEQRAIAHVLRTVQRAKEATEGVIAALKELKKSLMQHLFTYGPVPVTERERVPLQETEIGPLPKEWRVVRLGEVAEKPQYGFTAAAQRDPVGPKMMRITDIQDGNVNWNAVPYCECGNDDIPKYLLEAGDILFARTGSVGKAFLVSSVPEPSIFASYLIRVRVDRTRLDPQFAFLFMQSAAYWSQIASQTHGAVQPNINATQLRSLLLPLPPLPEQRAIAHVLRTVQRAKEATEGVIAALKELKKSLMQHLFTYGPVPVTERERVPLQETEIGPIPAHWRVVRLGEVGKVVRGASPRPKGDPRYFGGTIPRLMVEDVTRDYKYVIPRIDFLTVEGAKLSRFLPKGTVVIQVSGNPGTPAILGVDACIHDGFAAIQELDINKIAAEFLFYWLDQTKQRHKRLAFGAVFQNLQTYAIRDFVIPLPPLDEQREIARILQAVDAKIAAEQARRAALEELFKSLLHELMSGRLRLPNIVGRQRSRDSAPDADPLPELED